MNKNYEALFNKPFFVLDEPNEKNISEQMKYINDYYKAGYREGFYDSVIGYIFSKDSELYNYSLSNENNDKLCDAVHKIFMKFLSTENIIEYFYDDEETQKIEELIEKRNFKYGKMRELADKFLMLIDALHVKTEELRVYLAMPVKEAALEIIKDDIIKTHSKLKEKLDKICSGINLKCYLKLDNNYSRNFNEQIAEYILSKHGYDFSFRDYSKYLTAYESYQLEKDYEVLGKILGIDDISSIEQGYKVSYPICNLLNLVLKYNDIRHVEKIVDYCFNEYTNNSIGRLIYDNKLPLVFKYDFNKKILEQANAWLYNRIFYVNGSNLSNDELEGLLYPLKDIDSKMIDTGKKVFDEFIKAGYPEQYEQVLKIFENFEAIIRDGDDSKELKIKNLSNTFLFGYQNNCSEERFLNTICEDFSNSDNSKNRFYYVVYLISKKITENTNGAIYEYFYNLLDLIDKKYGFTSKFKQDTSKRELNYLELKKILKKYGFNLSERFKDRYIVALLDRKSAITEEIELFPELEMKGDAIYNFVISEILFYSQEKYECSFGSLVSADQQILVAKKLGVDKLYISNLNSIFNKKLDIYEDYESMSSGKHHYIADSLEMIIGVLYEEFGLEKTMNFVERIVLETFNDLKKPLKLNEIDAIKSNFDREYLKKIFPCLFSNQMEDEYELYNIIETPFNKLLLVLSIGTDEKAKRNFITNNLWGHDIIYDSYEKRYDALGIYLHYGIEAAVDASKEFIVAAYNKRKR